MEHNYISKVVIENFQSHEYTEMELTPGLNVIVGPSDSGKTAIIRAIKWVLYNEPRGMEFIRRNASYCRVTLYLSDQTVITRERSLSYNRYILINNKGEKHVFEGFGNDVPVEIVKAHGARRVVLDEDNVVNINIGQQLEGPFMLAESGSTRAKALGRLVGVHIIDRAMQSTITDISRLQQQIKQWDQELVDVNDSLDEFRDLDKIANLIYEQSRNIDELEGLLQRTNALLALYYRLKSIDEELKVNQSLLSKLKNISLMECFLDDISKLLLKEKQLQKLNQQRLAIERAIDYNTSVIKALSGVNEAERCIQEAQSACDVYNRYVALYQTWIKVQQGIKRQRYILDQVKNIDECQSCIIEAENGIMRQNKLLSLYKSFNALNREIDLLINNLSKLNHISVCEMLMTNIERYKISLQCLQDAKKRLKDVDNRIAEGHKYIENLILEINKKVGKYAQILEQVGKCPICMAQIDTDTINDIISAYRS